MKKIVVVGAGLSGLSTALYLHRLGMECEVVESQGEVGGACRTLHSEGFHFDLTGHLLHLGQRESEALLRDLGVLPLLKRHTRSAGIALAGTVTPYPIQIHTYRLPRSIRRDCLLGFVEAQLEEGEDEEGSSFAEWVLRRFGGGFACHFFFPYNRKLYCTDPHELTTEWVGRYVPRPSLADVIDGAFGLYHGPVGYNATFLYPREGGIRLLADTLAEHVGGIRLGSRVTAIDPRRNELHLDSGECVRWDVLVATIPLTELVRLTVDPPAAVVEAAEVLRAVSVININLGVKGRARRREHWLYVPEECFPFYRVGIPSNHGAVAPPGHHTLSVEVSVPHHAPAPADLERRCLAGLEELGLLRDSSDVRTLLQTRLETAYVVFDRARPKAVASLRTHFRNYGVLLAGRWAEWKYSTMEDALWDGAAAARRIERALRPAGRSAAADSNGRQGGDAGAQGT